MTDFLDGLGRDLVEAMERHESRRRRVLRIPRPGWRRALVGVAAAAVVAAVGLSGLRSIETEREVAVEPPDPRLAAALAGQYVSAGGGNGFQLLIAGTRYTLIRCDGRDCGFDVFDGGAAGTDKVRVGRVVVRERRAVFSGDATCPSSRGTYSVRLIAGTPRFQLVHDPCRSRARAIAGSRWIRTGP